MGKKMMIVAALAIALCLVLATGGCKPGSSTACPKLSVPRCGTVSNGVAVSGVVVHDSCESCPEDTTYEITDVVTAGGPWKICTCKEQQE